MSNNEINPMGNVVSQALAKELEGVLSPLKQWIYSTFTYKLELNYLKRKKEVAKYIDSYDPNLEDFEVKPIFDADSVRKYIDEIIFEAQKIAPKDLVFPDKDLIGTIINSSQYFIDDEILRKNYAKLLAATIDNSKANLVHKSFAKTLEELSPIEIKIIDKLFRENFLVYCDSIRVYNISFKENPDKNLLEKSKKIHIPVEPVVFFKDDTSVVNELSFLDLSTSLSILQKTNLVKSTVLAAHSLDNTNLSFNQQEINRLAKKYIKSPKKIARKLLNEYYNLTEDAYQFAIEPNLQYYELTNYGKAFCNIIYSTTDEKSIQIEHGRKTP